MNTSPINIDIIDTVIDNCIRGKENDTHIFTNILNTICDDFFNTNDEINTIVRTHIDNNDLDKMSYCLMIGMLLEKIHMVVPNYKDKDVRTKKIQMFIYNNMSNDEL